jgi:hypothetical protein
MRMTTRQKPNRVSIAAVIILTVLSCDQEVVPRVDDDAVFLEFYASGQTVLPASIRNDLKQVKLEVGRNVDVTALIPEFHIPDGYSVSVNGVKQIAGASQVDFTKPVAYQLTNENNQTTSWEVSVVSMSCRIIIDASHDGGVWWFPQSIQTGFDPDKPHQGQAFANILRSKGFEVTELGRGVELNEEMFFGHYIAVRAGGLEGYTARELEVYSKLVDRGMNLVFFTDHKKHDPVDELGDHLGLTFKGSANGSITHFAAHQITANIQSISYIAGSVLIDAERNSNIEVLGWLGADDFVDLNFNNVKDADEPVAAPVMGILNYPKSRIFFIGDMNGIEVRPQPFINNLLTWMGDCSRL